MNTKERQEFFSIAKQVRNQYIPLPSKKDVAMNEEFIQEVYHNILSNIRETLLDKLNSLDNPLFLEKEYSNFLAAQAEKEYQKAMKDCWTRHFEFNGNVAAILRSDLSLPDSIREIYRKAAELGMD